VSTENGTFSITVEVVPPAGPDAQPLLSALESVSGLPFDGFSVATNPVAKPRMSALALSVLLEQHTGKPATLHCTTRDHNRLSTQGLLWGARALGITSVLIASGDYVALGDRSRTTTVRDLDVYALVQMAREAGLHTGVVLDPRPESNRLEYELRRLERKVEAGAQFVVTQPIYDEPSARTLHAATANLGIPIILGILPLRTARHAWFLHHRVAGIAIPEHIQERMEQAADPLAEGTAGARYMLAVAQQLFAGACIMPPFDHYEILVDILS
jgi:methylenetetrahydrofolate reductase (NADPH)